MIFGICAGADRGAAIKAAGWDYIEESVQGLLQPQLPDDQWQGLARARASALPILAANVLMPASMKISGPAADINVLRTYMQTAMRRAAQVGIKTIVFGSGGSRQVPEGWDRQRARQQIIDFAKIGAQAAADNGVLFVVEPLNKRECNIINSIADAAQYVKDVDHPSFRMLADAYHFWVDNDSLDDLAAAAPLVRHVHLADRDGRVPPGQSAKADYRPFFRVLKKAGYDGPMSVEASWRDIPIGEPRVLAFIRKQWEDA
jgi:sugar phosphate isomerase/epimerase